MTSGDLARFVQTCTGIAEGHLFVAVGREPYRDEKGKYCHRDWAERSFRWPQQRDRMLTYIRQSAPQSDVYLCPYAMRTPDRRQGNSAMRVLIHADADRGADPALVAEFGGFVIQSGTPGHQHVYVPLAWPVTLDHHRALCVGLRDRLGGDDKIADNDVLRPPNTFNQKPTLDGQPPAPVTVTWPDGNLTRIDPMTLAVMLGVDWSNPAAATNGQRPRKTAATNSERPHSDDYEITELDLDQCPGLQAALTYHAVPADRSKDTYRIALACRDAGLVDLPQVRWVVYQRADLKQRLLERNDDDLAAIWDKITNRSERIGVDPRFDDAPPPEPADDAAPPDNPDDPGPDEPPPSDDPGRIKHSGQLRMAYELAKHYKDKLLFVYGIGWHHWDGKRWAFDDGGAAKRAVYTVLKQQWHKAFDQDEDLRKELIRDIKACESANGTKGVLDQASALVEFAATSRDLDANPYLFNCANGTVDLQSIDKNGVLKIRRHRPADRITKVANGSYRPETEIDKLWLEFLTTILPPTDVRAYIRRVIGLSSFGQVNGDKELVIICHGDGANGKSKFSETVCYALGDYATPAEPGLLMTRRGETHPTGQADLFGRRLVTTTETEEGERFNLALLKRLSGGDKLKARFMRKDFFEFTPTHLLLMHTNHKPVIHDESEAVWRRIRLIPFTVTIPKNKRDKDLGEKLEAKADSVLTWALQGWVDYRRNGGMREPADVLDATKKYRGEADIIGRFLAEACFTGGAQSKEKTTALYRGFERWCSQEQITPVGKHEFGRTLDAKGYPVDPHDEHKRRCKIQLHEDYRN